MHLIDTVNENDVKKIKEWAINNEQNNIFLSGKDVLYDSYYKTRECEETYISVYDFGTLPELERMYNNLFNEQLDREIQRIAAVCAMRYKPDLNSRPNNQGDIKENLPEHIYVF